MRRAVSCNALEVAWQPQVELPSGRLTGAEALVRWTRIDGTEVPPDRFIPLAERDGLITRIDDQVLEIALRDLAAWRATGYSSLAYLRELPIDRIKIDRSFIADIAEHATSREIVRSVIARADRIGLRVITEGIETQGQLQFLGDMGCMEGQGFLMGRPMRACEFSRWVKAG